jgi:hypothetical protein
VSKDDPCVDITTLATGGFTRNRNHVDQPDRVSHLESNTIRIASPAEGAARQSSTELSAPDPTVLPSKVWLHWIHRAFSQRLADGQDSVSVIGPRVPPYPDTRAQ